MASTPMTLGDLHTGSGNTAETMPDRDVLTTDH